MMIEYFILLAIALLYGIWLKTKKRQLNRNMLLFVHLAFAVIVIGQFFLADQELSICGYHDLIFYVGFQCTGIILFFIIFQNKKEYLLKVYASLLMILIMPTCLLLLLDERPQITKVNENIEIRRIHGKILTYGHRYNVVVNKYFLFEKSLSTPGFPSGFFEKTKEVKIQGNKVIITVHTTDGDTETMSVKLP